MRKKLFSKQLVCCMMVLVMVFGMTNTASAWTARYAKCPRCGVSNKSYGYEGRIYTDTLNYGPGKTCPVCNIVVPVGSKHYVDVIYDRYYFLCNGSKCSGLSIENRKYTILVESDRQHWKK